MSDILQTLVAEDFGIEGRGKWYHAVQHDSFVVNADDGTWFWNSRGLKGDALDYLIQIRGYSKEQAKDFLKNYHGAIQETSGGRIQSKPYERLVDIFWDNGKATDKRDYWYRRMLRDDTIDRYKLGHYNGWNLIPFYENGEFVNFQCRRDIPNKAIDQWYRTGKTFLYNAGILPFTKTVYITEGTVDTILLNQEGFPAVSPNGTNTFKVDYFPLFMNVDTIYYVEDNDAAGRLGSRLVANILGLERVKIVSYFDRPEKYDTVNLFQDGGNADEFREWVGKAKFLFELEDITPKKEKRRNGHYFTKAKV